MLPRPVRPPAARAPFAIPAEGARRGAVRPFP